MAKPEAEYRWNALAGYNSERGRGVLHDAATDERMAIEQAAFDQEQIERRIAEGWTYDTFLGCLTSPPRRKKWWRRG